MGASVNFSAKKCTPTPANKKKTTNNFLLNSCQTVHGSVRTDTSKFSLDELGSKPLIRGCSLLLDQKYFLDAVNAS